MSKTQHDAALPLLSSAASHLPELRAHKQKPTQHNINHMTLYIGIRKGKLCTLQKYKPRGSLNSISTSSCNCTLSSSVRGLLPGCDLQSGRLLAWVFQHRRIPEHRPQKRAPAKVALTLASIASWSTPVSCWDDVAIANKLRHNCAAGWGKPGVD